MLIAPDPIAFVIGPLEIRWYGLLAAIGLIAGYYLAPFLAKRWFDDNRSEIYQNAVMVAIIGGIIGARIVHVILEWSVYAGDLSGMIAVWNGGLSFHGGVIGGAAALAWYARRLGVPLIRFTDVVAAPLALALAIGRIGNIMNSEILGKACESCWFSLTFERDSESLARHPVQIYSLIKNVLVAGFVVWMMDSCKRAGSATAAFMIGYGVLRFLVEFFRPEPLILGLSLAQYVSILMIALGVWILKKRKPQ